MLNLCLCILFIAVLLPGSQPGKCENNLFSFFLPYIFVSLFVSPFTFYIHAAKPTKVPPAGASGSATAEVALAVSLAAVAIVIIVFVIKKYV